MTTQEAVAFIRSAETATVTEYLGSFRLYMTSAIMRRSIRKFNIPPILVKPPGI